MKNGSSAVVGVAVSALLMSTLAISNSALLSVFIVLMSLFAGSGAFMLMKTMSKPPVLPAPVAMDDVSVVDDAVRDIGVLMSKTLAAMATRSPADRKRWDGDDDPLKDYRDMLSSMNALMIMPEFMNTSHDDQTLMCSLVSSFLPDTFANIMSNTRYLSFSGEAHDKAMDNLREICRQISYVNGSIGKIQESVVSDNSTDVAVGTEYLKSRINDDDSSSLTIESMMGRHVRHDSDAENAKV